DVAGGAEGFGLLDLDHRLAEQRPERAVREPSRWDPYGLLADRHHRQLRHDVGVNQPRRAGLQARRHARVHLQDVFLLGGSGGLAAFDRLRDEARGVEIAGALTDATAAHDLVVDRERELALEGVAEEALQRRAITQQALGRVGETHDLLEAQLALADLRRL